MQESLKVYANNKKHKGLKWKPIWEFSKKIQKHLQNESEYGKSHEQTSEGNNFKGWNSYMYIEEQKEAWHILEVWLWLAQENEKVVHIHVY